MHIINKVGTHINAKREIKLLSSCCFTWFIVKEELSLYLIDCLADVLATVLFIYI